METHEQTAALWEHKNSQEIIYRLAEEFGVETDIAQECLIRIVKKKDHLNTGLWSVCKKENEFF